MSQRMEFDEPESQQQSSSYSSYQAGYRDPFAGSFAQKIPSSYSGGNKASAGQRLALAIVSLCLLVPLAAIILGIAVSALGYVGLVGSIIGLGAICVTIIAVNFFFNRS